MSETVARTPDGLQRTPASTRRRARAVDAFIDLVLEGNLPPTTEQVAERAGISMATLFRYFESLEVMRRDAAIRMLERFPLLHVSDVGEGPRRERIERFAATRVALWEKVHLLALLQRSIVLQDPDAAQMVDFVRGVMADEVREHFAPELRGLTSALRDDVVALIASLTSVESWEQFIHTYGRSPLQTRRAWAQAIDAILSGGSER
ncbi:MAG TPA: TetR/AcrR family transcriptional regulator [Myxococcales bacterium]|nr:TetR/AcrR family transcriptional regulator [Myxococcales bacterium]HIL79808.1 TetR/AcrR family transcriptional regulator [Myxococcales bacterium]